MTLAGAAVRVGGRAIWHDANLGIDEGEFVAVLGPNGSGKSTLLKALLGMLPLVAGEATILGRPVRRGNPEVGYLPQRRTFDSDLRIRGVDLVTLGLDGTRWGIPLPGAARRRTRERVGETIALVGATAYAGRPIGELSGGEQQRILIAQALVGGARLLALDEPLDSLDIANQQAISHLLRTLCRDRGVTVLLVAHDVNPLLGFLDQVVYVAGGRVVSGRPEQVITTKTLSALYGSRVEVLTTSDGRLVVVGQQDPVSYHGHTAHGGHPHG